MASLIFALETVLVVSIKNSFVDACFSLSAEHMVLHKTHILFTLGYKMLQHDNNSALLVCTELQYTAFLNRNESTVIMHIQVNRKAFIVNIFRG